MRVLSVDDDRINSLLLVETCRFAPGVEIETAASGVEALELAARWRPDLLVIDLHLPDTHGYALLQSLRAQLAPRCVAAFLCTADEAPLVAAQALAAGFDGCWTKPVDLSTVLQELARRSAEMGSGS